MVAYCNESDIVDQPKTLTYWVRNFRMKRVQMRRKMRGSGSLRVNAILSTALFHAEHELRRKQQERFSRWLDIQTKFTPHGKTHCASDDDDDKYQRTNCDATVETAECERRSIENNLWRSELSGLDSFLSSLSSSKSNNINENGTSNNYNKQSNCAIAVNS